MEGRPESPAPRDAVVEEVPQLADGDWRAELKQGSTYLARDLTVAAESASRAAKELHEDLSTPIDEMIEEARSHRPPGRRARTHVTADRAVSHTISRDSWRAVNLRRR